MAGSYRKRGNNYLLEYMYKGKRYNKTSLVLLLKTCYFYKH